MSKKNVLRSKKLAIEVMGYGLWVSGRAAVPFGQLTMHNAQCTYGFADSLECTVAMRMGPYTIPAPTGER